MIRLFRIIRFDHLIKNKDFRYPKYAIGEIILIMVGILLALQVNNWNEIRKNKIREIGHLRGIKQDILLDLNDVNWNLEFHKQTVKAQKELLSYLMGEVNAANEMIAFENALGTPISLSLHESSYTNLKNDNFNLISNKELKKQISNYYDIFSRGILGLENDMVEYQSYSVLKPYFLKYFMYVEPAEVEKFRISNKDYYSTGLQLNKLIPADRTGLINDKEFKIALAETIRFTNTKIKTYNEFINRVNELMISIDEELKSIE